MDGGRPYEKEPKTDGSRRTIPLTKRLYAVLRAMLAVAERGGSPAALQAGRRIIFRIFR